MPLGAAKMGTQRDLRIDFFRGLALVFIFIDHVPGNDLARFTLRNFGFSDAAEVFVLLAGFSAVLAYLRITNSRLRAASKVAGRHPRGSRGPGLEPGGATLHPGLRPRPYPKAGSVPVPGLRYCRQAVSTLAHSASCACPWDRPRPKPRVIRPGREAAGFPIAKLA